MAGFTSQASSFARDSSHFGGDTTGFSRDDDLETQSSSPMQINKTRAQKRDNIDDINPMVNLGDQQDSGEPLRSGKLIVMQKIDSDVQDGSPNATGSAANRQTKKKEVIVYDPEMVKGIDMLGKAATNDIRDTIMDINEIDKLAKKV